MEATSGDLENLLKMQEVDIVAINAQKRLDALPQRGQLRQVAQKKQAVLEKQGQVDKMHDAARRKVTQIEDEMAILTRKQGETQEKIDTAAGDYRAVQSLTRDLDGVAKRLGVLEDELAAASEKLDQVTGVRAQVSQAIAALDAQALQLRESFQKDAGELQATIADAQSRHDAIAAGIDPAVVKAYLEACKRGGGVGVARLADNRCGTCRNVIDPNRLLIVRREAPLSRCPSCRRLLIVTS